MDNRQIKQFPSTYSRKNKEVKYFDYTFVFVLSIIIVFGLVMVYSASYYEAMTEFGDPNYYFKKQLISTCIGLVGLVVVACIPYRFYRNFGILPYAFCLLMIVLIFPFGVTANGATRWIAIGPIQFQAAEPIKLGMIVFLANYIQYHRKETDTFSFFLKVMAYAGVISVLIWQVTDNLSSAIIVAAISFLMVFVSSRDYRKYILMAIGAVAVAALVVAVVIYSSENADSTGGFRSERILAWLDLEKYASGTGLQTLQSLYAIGSGGIAGKGLGESMQKLNFLPEAQNDMIFSIICEELGLFGGISIILLFAILIWRMVVIAINASDIQGGMLVVGVIAHIAVQVILNIAVVTNTIPNTGISLPFISYGGTSVAFLLAEMGLVFSVSRGIKLSNVR
ncbi:MAG: putative peptidoglycan glycosyltransferase FtsW [Lachnospiraceae bacterium]